MPHPKLVSVRPEELAALRDALEECQTQLWHAIEAKAYKDKPLQWAMERARSMAITALAGPRPH